MSQPPPPPQNQPPAPEEGFGPPPSGTFGPPAGGGFGPPSSGAYGAPPPAPGTPPSAPPAVPGGKPGEPGYGYPQTPAPSPAASPAPPPAAPPGAPPAAPPSSTGGFGAPTPPGPYGPDTMPPGTFGPPPSGRRRRWSAPALIVAVSAVLALALAGSAVYLLNGDDGAASAQGENQGEGDGEGQGAGGDGGQRLPEQPVDASLAWQQPAPDITEDESLVYARGVWFSGDTVVRTIDDSLTAYDLASGEEAWSIPLELSNGNCNASRNVDDNRIAVLQGRDCEVLSVFDIAAGEEIATIDLDSSLLPGRWDYPAILGDTVAVDLGVYGAGYSISRQEQVWESGYNARCAESAYATFDDMFVSQTSCGFNGDEGGSIRATTEAGEELWEWSYEATYDDEEFAVNSVVSVEPLVVTASVGEEERILVIDEDYQEIRHVLEYDSRHFQSPCEINAFTACDYGIVHDGHLYLSTYPQYGEPTGIVAFDLETGTAIYELESASGGPARPFGVADGKILIYEGPPLEESGYREPGQVLALDPATEEATPVMTLDPQEVETESAMASSGTEWHQQRLAWHNNTLVFLNESFYWDSAEETPAMLVYR
ncbi:PQQ-binding-like beta-propeller repeat protein [Streptomyces sp. 7-21]|uniref:outer membrane protein assembly factor BamB family protein n=1 Tax=Streptomyces sp. 7-21 TaxID=2802283 RepID=UPI00191EDE80|nr:PQQ-binding-like beta-propeller repeat protein [Streptomyces sp. 7-21]MBL1068674.1 PQQ-binding-like beta-propeller repeat protein [Streptomyces sp. 7-21]